MTCHHQCETIATGFFVTGSQTYLENTDDATHTDVQSLPDRDIMLTLSTLQAGRLRQHLNMQTTQNYNRIYYKFFSGHNQSQRLFYMYF